MARIYQVPSHARGWLTLAIIATSLPQLVDGPWWQSPLLLLVLGWRALVDRQRLLLPGRVVRLALLLATVAATWQSFGRLHGPEAGTALITGLFALKYLELVGKRDAYVLIVLGYFVCATILLFHQGPLAALYVVGCLVLLTASLAGINYGDTHARGRQHLGVAAVMVLQALPLAAILFVLVPRVAPLWNMHLDSGQARTGMSDSMSPGQVSRLTESAELAFRVQFDGPAPAPSQRYWRGLTYSYFDGTTWRQARPPGWGERDTLYHGRGPAPDWYRGLRAAAGGPAWEYRVIMEPSQQRWLYALAVPFTDLDGLALARDLRLVADAPVTGTLGYRVRSVPAAGAGATLDGAERALMLSLPEQGNERARALAADWRRRYPNDRALVNAALGYFREQPFFYTLEPPPVTGDTVDRFLFDTRRGFCEHYASSFTFLMRAAGVPARVVAGYQGGEPNGDYLQVRQYDAHAWSEVWLAGRWVRVDPTGAVAPDRIELGLRQAMRNRSADQADGEGGAFGRLPVLFRLQQWADYVDFNWQKWVLGYRQEEQRDLLERLLGAVTPTRIALALLGAVLLVTGLLALLVLNRRRDQPARPLEREFRRLRQALGRRGLALPEAVSAAGLEAAVARRWPAATGAAGHWRRYFEHLAYRRDGDPPRSERLQLARRRRALMRALRG
ncbi:transglutaminaseTgpA domain-containing protein [Alloalcanivorax marinus]|uniref:transglutaminase family protein n=1 Tax=Alloalcanivorax marinus TaxID=1177169 RepID=UPI00195DA4FB|nr:DUF3488 and transglutaminase-like domain-containing protein [Alloalcanivorax marinus]MBM7333334.1 DUF3488 domain-containing transglutaminase family protein [Alloalcanivorax marinus]